MRTTFWKSDNSCGHVLEHADHNGNLKILQHLKNSIASFLGDLQRPMVGSFLKLSSSLLQEITQLYYFVWITWVFKIFYCSMKLDLKVLLDPDTSLPDEFFRFNILCVTRILRRFNKFCKTCRHSKLRFLSVCYTFKTSNSDFS